MGRVASRRVQSYLVCYRTGRRDDVDVWRSVMDPAAAETEPRGERRPVTRVSREPDTAFLSCSVEPTLSVHSPGSCGILSVLAPGRPRSGLAKTSASPGALERERPSGLPTLNLGMLTTSGCPESRDNNTPLRTPLSVSRLVGGCRRCLHNAAVRVC
eukprot:scaffold47995_cov58-Phaeocystis_antarctica.AAC.2